MFLLLRLSLRTQLVQCLLDHACGIDALCPGVDQLAGNDVDDFVLCAFEFGTALLLADLEFSMV